MMTQTELFLNYMDYKRYWLRLMPIEYIETFKEFCDNRHIVLEAFSQSAP